jgi:hypothetical protein
LIIIAYDFRRASGRQLQRNGIDIDNLQKSTVILNSSQVLQDIYYTSA